MKTSRLLIGIAISAVTAFAMGDDLIYDSRGFESVGFSPGPLDGQDGWSAFAVGAGAVEPMIITPPDPCVGDQALRFQVPNTAGTYSTASISIADAIAAGYTKITVSFDIFRHPTTPLLQELWWWWSLSGSPWYGLQYDLDYSVANPGVTTPFANRGSRVTIRNRWTNVVMEWDFAIGKVSSFYDGLPVDVLGPMGAPLTSLDTFTIHFASSSHGSAADVAWIDNFLIAGYPEIGFCSPCDANCDGSVNLFDIEPFVNQLSSGDDGCSACAADANNDGSVNLFDISYFVDCLTGG